MVFFPYNKAMGAEYDKQKLPVALKHAAVNKFLKNWPLP